MKIKSTKTQQVYEVILTRQGENHQPCPECSKDLHREIIRLKYAIKTFRAYIRTLIEISKQL